MEPTSSNTKPPYQASLLPKRPHTSVEARRSKSFKDTAAQLETKLKHRLATNKKLVPRKESDKRANGPLVAKHDVSNSARVERKSNPIPVESRRRSLRPTSPTYESVFKRHIVNVPSSPGPNPRRSQIPGAAGSSFNKGRKSGVIPQEVLTRKIHRARKMKLYLLQQAGPNSFVIGGETADQRHKVIIGQQYCSCGKGPHCVHILFIMSRVFQLSDIDPLIQVKQLKNFEVEGLFKEYELRRKQRVYTRGMSDSSLSTSIESKTDEFDLSTTSNTSKDETTCPICLLQFSEEEGEVQLVTCSHCQNNLHKACMAIWYRQERSNLKCPLCMEKWTETDFDKFEEVLSSQPQTPGINTECVDSNERVNSHPLGDIDSNTLLPRSQPIPAEYRQLTRKWRSVFGEDLIGCLFMKTMWTVRETALKHLSREVVLQLSAHRNSDNQQQSVEEILEICCQILVFMIGDPVYKVYVAALRAVRTMLSYCSLPDITNLQIYMRSVTQSIILKCADGNRKTNQLALSTLSELAKGQSGELAIGKELPNNDGQACLGGCVYILDCCVDQSTLDLTQWQCVIGRLLAIDHLLQEYSELFDNADDSLLEHTMIPVVQCSIYIMSSVAHNSHHIRCTKLCKRVYSNSIKYLTVLPDMMSRIREMLVHLEPELRSRLEKRLFEASMPFSATRQGLAENLPNRSKSVLDHLLTKDRRRVETPPLMNILNTPPSSDPVEHPTLRPHKHRHAVCRQMSFGSIYPEDASEMSELPPHDRAGELNVQVDSNISDLVISRLVYNRSDSYTEAVHAIEQDLYEDSSEDEIQPETQQIQQDYDIVDIPPLNFDRNHSPPTPPPGGTTLPLVVNTGPSGEVFDEASREWSPGVSPSRKLSRGKVITSGFIKPNIHVQRISDEIESVEADSPMYLPQTPPYTDTDMPDIPVPETELVKGVDIDCVDGDIRMDVNRNNLISPGQPAYLRDQSVGFEVTADFDVTPRLEDTGLPEQSGDNDSNSEGDRYSGSVTLSIEGSADESDELSSSYNIRSSIIHSTQRTHHSKYKTKNVPFRKYRKHVRSKTDPVKVSLLNTTGTSAQKSPRYFSDPAVGDSTSTTSSSCDFDDTPRTPPISASTPPLNTDRYDSDDDNPTLTSPEVRESSVRTEIIEPETQPPNKSRQLQKRKPLQAAGPVSPVRPILRKSPTLRDDLVRSPEKLAIVHPQPQTPPTSPPRPHAALRSPPRVKSPVRAVRVISPVRAGPSRNNVVSTKKRNSEISIKTGEPVRGAVGSVVTFLTSSTSSSGDERRIRSCRGGATSTQSTNHISPYEKPVSFQSEVRLFSPRDVPKKSTGTACKDAVELEEAVALVRAMELSEQPVLPHVPGLSQRERQETITIHVQSEKAHDNTDSRRVQYIEDVHWKRGMVLGNGGFCTCYQARDIKTGIIMALKQISFCRNTTSEQEEACHEIVSEVRTMAGLNHPNIVRILGATQTGAHFNIFLEWMPGGSIAHLLDQYGAFSEPVISSYTHQILLGLTYLHENFILHRDMKGANLFIDSTGKHLRIGDFGACARLASKMTGAGEFRGQLLGTIAFMAPEVLRGEDYGRACDVWSVGCVIIEMCTTKPPWNENGDMTNHLKLIFKIASAQSSPPIPENLPPAIKDLMLRCLEPKRADRPSAKELLAHPLFTRYNFHKR